MAAPYEVRYVFGDGSIEAAVDVRNGRIFKLIASREYKGGFGDVHVGMLVRDAIRVNPHLYYSEPEECILCEDLSGLVFDVPVRDPDPFSVLDLAISHIAVYASEIETPEGQDGKWYRGPWRKQETDLGGRVHQFTYDKLGRLTQEGHLDLGPGGTQYFYDRNDNRTRVVRNGQSEWYGVADADKLLWTNTEKMAAPLSA
jgi:hypothetical protein